MKKLKNIGKTLIQVPGFIILILYIIGHHLWEAIFDRRKKTTNSIS